jgi:integrase/recombinase XerD
MSSEGLMTYWDERLPKYTGSTYHNRRRVLRSWLDFFEETERDLDAVVKEDVVAWMEWLRDEKRVVHSTINQWKIELSTVYSWLVANDYCEDIFDELEKTVDYDWLDARPEKSKESAQGVTYVTRGDYKKLFSACESDRERVIVGSLAVMGLRRCELAWLQLESFEWENNEATIKTAKQSKPEKMYQPGFYTTSHKLLMKRWIDGERKAFAPASSSPHLLTGHKREMIRPREITTIVREIADRAGIQAYREQEANGHGEDSPRQWAKVTPHALRHSYGVWRAKAGMPLSQLSRLMRHSDVQTTHDYYLRFSNDDLKDAYDRYQPE